MPKIEKFEWTVPGTPEEVAERLRAQTRFRLFPYQGTWIFLDTRPLGGRVSKNGFRVSLNKRDFWQRMQPVARAKLEARGGGTHIVGEAGLPPLMTWYLRLALIFIAVMTVGISTSAILAGQAPAEVLLTVLPILLVGGVAGSAGIGYHVAHADDQVRDLVDALSAAVHGGPQPTGQAEARLPRESREEASEAARSPDRETEG